MNSLHYLAIFSILLTNCGDSSSSSPGAASAPINDPAGYYTLRSDASITKHPPAGSAIGKGKIVEFQYDGSKGSILSYQLYYVDNRGSVHPMGGGNLDDKGNGIHSQEITVFNSSADQRPGFMEVTTVTGSGLNASGQITGKNVSLGMYAVHFEVSE